jgi:hypothetical protein
MSSARDSYNPVSRELYEKLGPVIRNLRINE